MKATGQRRTREEGVEHLQMSLRVSRSNFERFVSCRSDSLMTT